MWKIKNTTNTAYLKEFESNIIIPIFKMIHDVIIDIDRGVLKLPLETKGIWQNTAIYLGASDDQKKLFSHIMQKTISGKKLEDLIYLIVVTCKPVEVEYTYKLYRIQNKEIYDSNYAIQQTPINEYFKSIFVDFYYNNFFVDDKVWMIIAGENYNRSSFHRNFKSDNKLAVCPYCDIDTTIAISNNNIEHFLPKSKYPLLAMNPLNLISSCPACNKAHEGKGDKVSQPPIVTPYNEMMGDFAEFDVDFLSETITLHNKGGQAHHNYFELLKLYSRYSDPFIFECVNDAAHSLFETLSNYTTPSKDAIDLYIKRREKKNSLSFVLKSVVNKYSQYKSFN